MPPTCGRRGLSVPLLIGVGAVPHGHLPDRGGPARAWACVLLSVSTRGAAGSLGRVCPARKEAPHGSPKWPVSAAERARPAPVLPLHLGRPGTEGAGAGALAAEPRQFAERQMPTLAVSHPCPWVRPSPCVSSPHRARWSFRKLKLEPEQLPSHGGFGGEILTLLHGGAGPRRFGVPSSSGVLRDSLLGTSMAQLSPLGDEVLLGSSRASRS